MRSRHFMFDVKQILELHRQTVVLWHRHEVDNPHDGLLALVFRQHRFNYLLWHEEDIARSPDAGDARIAQVKRAIDRYNQQRNDAIEKIDDAITEYLAERHISAGPEARLNTETPGSAIDRLSILALRIYHLEEQLERSDASPEHQANVERKLAICRLQLADLSAALGELLEDILSGRKRHRTYRQCKMYNDPALNPYLYQAGKLPAAA